MRIVNLTRNTLLADEATIAESFSRRLVGLLNRTSLDKGQALVLKPSNSIHSFFMRFTIDVIFLDKSGKVIDVLPSFRPWCLSPVYFTAHLAIELPKDSIRSSQTQPGDIITIE
jgi:uncharacterized membrane protein (UPF0127 family)